MDKKTRQTLAQLEDMVKEEKHDPRVKFIRVKEACKTYKMSRPTIMKWTLDAGAMYRIGEEGKTILINTEIFDKYLETFRIQGKIR